jgi:hypothetical protein
MMLYRFLLSALLLTFFATQAMAGYLDDDCYDYMAGSRKIGANDRYISFDSAGIKEACRNKFKTWGERFTLKRDTSGPDTTYTVTRSYCWARNVFRESSCSWPTGPAWGDNYSAIFLPTDVRSPDDGDGRRILRSGGYQIVPKKNPSTGKPIVNRAGEGEVEVIGSGALGDHVCLKRFPPKSDMLPSGKNSRSKNMVCAYLVYALVKNSCTAPVGGWGNALIGCVEEPLYPGPPTYNHVMAAGIAPFTDPDIELEQYISKYNSTFSQPVIKLLNGKPAAENELLLRYKFPGDTTVIDSLPSSGSFKSDKQKKIYRAVVDPNNPGQICACEGAGCDNKVYIGCVSRPTPRDSNLKIVAEYTTGQGNAPAVRPAFVQTTTNGDIIYYDADGSLAQINADGNAFKTDKNGQLTSTPAKLPLKYKKLPLPPEKFAIREYYFNKDAKIYNRDVMTVYGVAFQAIIPQMQSDKVPAFAILDTRSESCNALKLADNQWDETKPSYFIPAGDRDRTYCNCPPANAENCPVPKVVNCNGIEHEEDALRIFCPGVLKTPSQVDKSNMICLQPASSWNFSNYEYDQMCVQIPTDCGVRTEPSISSGISAWPKLTRGATALGSCDMDTGIEQQIAYNFDPPTLIERKNFDCSKVTENCDYIYNNVYKIQFYRALKTLNSVQALANSLNRNLNENDKQIINRSLGDFSSFHTLKANQPIIPKRSCSMLKTLEVDCGLIKGPCMIQNSCGELKRPAYITGYAVWDKIRDLNTEEQNKVNRLPFAEIYIEATGKCPAGYKEDKAGAPVRKCYSKYVNGERVGGRWLEVENPCIKLPPASLTPPAAPNPGTIAPPNPATKP